MDFPETGGEMERFELPELRLFRVTRKKPEFSDAELQSSEFVSSLEAIDIWAHTVQYGDSKVLAFFQLRLVEGRPVAQLTRVFAKWIDVEEVEVPKQPKSSIITSGSGLLN